MECRDFVARYSDYDDSLLTATELERFETHLSRCVSCARYDRVLRKGRMLARQGAAVSGGDQFMPRLQRRLWHDRTHARRASAAPGGVATALAGLTVVLTAFWVVILMDPDRHVSSDPSPPLRAAGELAPEPAQWYEAGWGTLPVVDRPPAREWAALRVDPAVPVAYSPLVTGPPAYRVAATLQTSATITTRHTFD
jgi:anti-sigma factor RsiW